MCEHEIIGDYYRGCGHFHGRYFTGETKDCGRPTCKSSQSHIHKSAPNCQCVEYVEEHRTIQNLFLIRFGECNLSLRVLEPEDATRCA